MADRYSTADLFRELDGRSFSSYRKFEEAVIAAFNEHLDEFPPHYSYRNAIAWADQQGWLQTKNGDLKVDLSKAMA